MRLSTSRMDFHQRLDRVERKRRAAYVYLLRDPRTDAIRYVGCTIDPMARRRSHWRLVTHRSRGINDSYKDRWVRSLLRHGVTPQMTLACVVESIEEAKRVEVGLIAAFRLRGERLTNVTAGGDGATDPTPEVRAKLSAASRRMSRETIEKRNRAISEAQRANPAGLAERAKLIGDALRGRPKSAAHREALRAAKDRVVEVNGTSRKISEWARVTGIRRKLIATRLWHGWSIERALTTPSQRGPRT